MFGLGLIVGFLAGRPRNKAIITEAHEDDIPSKNHRDTREEDGLSEEDREYIR